MTTPFFLLIWSSILQKEIISLKHWAILIIGFAGTILIAKPTMFQTNIFIYLVFLVAAYNALTSVIVSKFSKNATALGYAFYNLLPLMGTRLYRPVLGSLGWGGRGYPMDLFSTVAW